MYCSVAFFANRRAALKFIRHAFSCENIEQSLTRDASSFFFFIYIYSFYFSLPISWHFIFDRKFNTRCCWRVQRNKADFNYDAEPRDLKSRLNNIKYKTGAVSKVTMLSTNINLVCVIFPPFLSFLNRELYRYAW